MASNAGDLDEDEIVISGSRVRDGAGGNCGHRAVVRDDLLRAAAERLPRRGHAARDGLPAGDPDGQEQRLLRALSLASTPSRTGGHRPRSRHGRQRSKQPASVPATSPKRPPTLFDDLREEPEEPTPPAGEAVRTDGVDRAAASPRQAYKDQKELIRRHAPEDERRAPQPRRRWRPAAAS